MISVVHIIQKNDSFTLNYISRLSKCIDNRITMQIAESASELNEMCKTTQPDIIHLHGNVTPPAGFKSVRCVISPNGSQLRLPASSSYYAIIARSRMEAKHIDKKRVEIVRNPVITKTTTFDKAAEQMATIYQKVMNSNVLPLMDQDTRLFMHLLLKAAIYRDRRWVKETLPSAPDWHKLSIFAHYEQIDDFLRLGASTLNIELPATSVDFQACYLPENYRKIEELSDFTVTDVLEKIHHGEVTYRRLTELNIALLRDDLDEEQLLQNIETNELKNLIGSCLQLLIEFFGLTEGFLPCQPIDNHVTQQLRTKLEQHLRL